LVNRIEEVQHLQNIYRILQEKHTPNIDELYLSFLDHNEHGSMAFLRPKGMSIRPVGKKSVPDAVCPRGTRGKILFCIMSAMCADSQSRSFTLNPNHFYTDTSVGRISSEAAAIPENGS